MPIFAIIHTTDNWQDVLIIIIPVVIIVIIAILIYLKSDRRVKNHYHLKNSANDFEKINQILIESSIKENQLKHLKEIIKHLINQRSLFSRLKLEVQGFDTMMSKQYRVNSIDFYTIQDRISNLENQINILKQYNEKNRKSFNQQTLQLIDENIQILTSTKEITDKLIQTVKDQDNKNYSELKIQFENQLTALIKLNQTLNNYIQQHINI